MQGQSVEYGKHTVETRICIKINTVIEIKYDHIIPGYFSIILAVDC